MTTNAIPEGNLLATLHPDLVNNSDEWPEFELKDVKVFTPNDPSNLTSLLEAAAQGPEALEAAIAALPPRSGREFTPAAPWPSHPASLWWPLDAPEDAVPRVADWPPDPALLLELLAHPPTMQSP